jgi:tetratricopeptide (TPR) repeat protein
MKSFISLFLFITMLASMGICADDPGQMLQEGLFLEYGTGDLNKAIELYEKTLRNGYEDEETAARALLRLGICYERAGRDEDAKRAYQQIISRFSGQRTVKSEAANRLRRLSSGLMGDGYWFRYKGEYIYLIGAGTASIYAGSGLVSGSVVTNDPVRAWKIYIDLLVQHGINFVRFQPWDFLNRSVVPDYACPWAITSEGPTYDLNRFNPRYWRKLKEIVSYANARDVFFEIVLFDDDSPWDKHPFNQKCGGALTSKAEYHNLGNSENKKYQEKYVSKTVDETIQYPNVIYEICDALGWEGKTLSEDMKSWVSYWVSFVDRRLPHLITVSQHSWSSDGELDILWEMPGIDIISVQESEGTKFALGMEYTHKHFLKYWQSGYKKPMMVNEANFGDMMEHPAGGTKGWIEERQHLWVAFTSGGHAARSDFQPFIENYPSFDSCLHLADFVRQVRFWEMKPLADFTPECDGICYSLGSGEEFVVYIRYIGTKEERKIKLNMPVGDYEARWYDPVQGNFLPEVNPVSSEVNTLRLPETATDVVLYIQKIPGV